MSKMTLKFLELKNNRKTHCIQNWRETHNVKKFNKIPSWNKSSQTWIRFRGCCCKKAWSATPVKKQNRFRACCCKSAWSTNSVKNRIVSAPVAYKISEAKNQLWEELFPRLLLPRRPYFEGRFRRPFSKAVRKAVVNLAVTVKFLNKAHLKF